MPLVFESVYFRQKKARYWSYRADLLLRKTWYAEEVMTKSVLLIRENPLNAIRFIKLKFSVNGFESSGQMNKLEEV